MTVGELIAELEKYPKDIHVIRKDVDPFNGNGSCFCDIYYVKHHESVQYVTIEDHKVQIACNKEAVELCR